MKHPLLRIVSALAAAVCIGLSFNLFGQDRLPAEPAAQAAQWQHLALNHDATKAWNDKELAKKINQLGRDGWELVSVLNFSKDGTTNSTIYYFKKPL